MTHGHSASIPNYHVSSHSSNVNGNDYRPSTSYSETHCRKQSWPLAQPSAGDYTPYQPYSYPVPQHPQQHHEHQDQPFQYQSQISLSQPLPSASASIDISDFFNAMPPSATGLGMNLENYQVVSGAKSARGHAVDMSRGSSSSGSAGMVGTPRSAQVDEDVDGEDALEIVIGEGK